MVWCPKYLTYGESLSLYHVKATLTSNQLAVSIRANEAFWMVVKCFQEFQATPVATEKHLWGNYDLDDFLYNYKASMERQGLCSLSSWKTLCETFLQEVLGFIDSVLTVIEKELKQLETISE